jgi:hypothetical protein
MAVILKTKTTAKPVLRQYRFNIFSSFFLDSWNDASRSLPKHVPSPPIWPRLTHITSFHEATAIEEFGR